MIEETTAVQGLAITYGYDSRDRLTSAGTEWHNGTGWDELDDRTFTIAYDDAGNRISVERYTEGSDGVEPYICNKLNPTTAFRNVPRALIVGGEPHRGGRRRGRLRGGKAGSTWPFGLWPEDPNCVRGSSCRSHLPFPSAQPPRPPSSVDRFSPGVDLPMPESDDFGLRWYEPTLGRFLNRDPISTAGGSNVYAFVGNNSFGGWDAWGLSGVVNPKENQRTRTPELTESGAPQGVGRGIKKRAAYRG